MGVSLICTVLNEQASIERLLRSVYSQTRKPDEFIIVDGGSRDGTVETIRAFFSRNKSKGIDSRVIVEKGANIARGRNVAIGNARHQIIAICDGGVSFGEDWLEKLVRPLEQDASADISAGVYTGGNPQTFFERASVELLYPKISRLKDGWAPSSRSEAYRKKVWEKTGGYPEFLYTAEDTVFHEKCNKLGFVFKLAKNAAVAWPPRNTPSKLFKQYYLYAKGNAQCLLILRWPYNKRLLLLLAFFVAEFFLLIFSSQTFFSLPLQWILAPIAPLIVLFGMFFALALKFKSFGMAVAGVQIIVITNAAHFAGIAGGILQGIKNKLNGNLAKHWL
ncbi:glycosyltransferase [Candidatus Parvarchaeota archaeon]|nr:glycosyltransferase [Candidatus Parvarchaeota archaeon]